MSSTLITFAVRDEALPFLRQGAAGADHLITNIGKAAAGRAMEEYLQTKRPALVLTCGFCGGLNPDLKSGDVVFDTPDAALGEKLSGAGLRRVRFHSSDRIIITAGEKRQLREATGCDVVEMESAAITEICRREGIPVATVRVVSDAADEDLPLDFNKITGPDGRLQAGKLGLAIVRSPGRISRLMQLARTSRAAARRLSEALIDLLRRPAVA